MIMWQPIDAAPRGPTILLYIPGLKSGEIHTGLWKYGWLVEGRYLYRDQQPTHWQPLPKPPGEREVTP